MSKGLYLFLCFLMLLVGCVFVLGAAPYIGKQGFIGYIAGLTFGVTMWEIVHQRIVRIRVPSIHTWKKEFYPRNARKIKNVNDALDSAILKYSGLEPKILAWHHLTLVHGKLLDDAGRIFEFDSRTCALCRIFKYGCESKDETPCPMTKVTGYACDDQEYGAYQRFIKSDDPTDMLILLEKAKEQYDSAIRT